MNPALPLALRGALEGLLEGRSGRALTERAAAISQHYRSGGGSGATIRTADDALAYALTRMPATYAATTAALDALAERAPELAPETLTDLGCGPGTAGWAAIEAFPMLNQLSLIDSNRALLDLAAVLLAPAERRLDPQFGDMARAAIASSDLVVASYTLTELPHDAALTVAERAWTATRQALVMVEPGTPVGWARLMAIRRRLLELGAVIAAPCPHAADCPVAAPDWCHFSQRLPRLRAHRALKSADAPFEDEKYAYLAAVRPDVMLEPARPRVLAPPVEGKVAVSLKLCEPDGALRRREIAKRDKAAFRAVRRLGWGDAL